MPWVALPGTKGSSSHGSRVRFVRRVGAGMHAHPSEGSGSAHCAVEGASDHDGRIFPRFYRGPRSRGQIRLRVQDVNDIIESAIGGHTIAMTVEGRERYPTNVRYARDFRDDLDSLKCVLVPTPTGAQAMLAEISNKTGPPSIRNENVQLVGFVFVDITTADIGGYVKVASERIGKRVRFPPGYYIQ